MLRDAEDLSAWLGNPADPESRGTWREILESDEAVVLPARFDAALRTWGFYDYLVPSRLGGRLRSLEAVFDVMRVVSRRDLRLSVGLGTTMLGANPVWLWGSPEQQQWLANRILAGAAGSFGMSERDHGSDLANCEVRAELADDEILLSGEKWPIGHGHKGTFVTLYARTGSGSYSLILVDKTVLPEDRWSPLPMVPTVGLRGHDLSGVTFDRCPVPSSAVIGDQGTGIAQTLKTLQVTRTLIAATSLGALDTALRLCWDYASTRNLYGGPILRIPAVRDTIIGAYLDLLICECVAMPVTRAIAVVPERMSLWSSVVKYFVPVVTDEALAELATVLSARWYLRDSEFAQIFQKMQRDHQIVGVFEGTTHVNLGVIASHLPAGAPPASRPMSTEEEVTLQRLFRGDSEPLWSPDGRKLRLLSPGHDVISAGWTKIRQQVEKMAQSSETYRDLSEVMARIDLARAQLNARITDDDAPSGSPRALPSRSFTTARIYTVLQAAASCAARWWYGGGPRDYPNDTGEWLVLCLHRLLHRIDATVDLPEKYLAAVEPRLAQQYGGTP